MNSLRKLFNYHLDLPSANNLVVMLPMSGLKILREHAACLNFKENVSPQERQDFYDVFVDELKSQVLMCLEDSGDKNPIFESRIIYHEALLDKTAYISFITEEEMEDIVSNHVSFIFDTYLVEDSHKNDEYQHKPRFQKTHVGCVFNSWCYD